MTYFKHGYLICKCLKYIEVIRSISILEWAHSSRALSLIFRISFNWTLYLKFRKYESKSTAIDSFSILLLYSLFHVSNDVIQPTHIYLVIDITIFTGWTLIYINTFYTLV